MVSGVRGAEYGEWRGAKVAKIAAKRLGDLFLRTPLPVSAPAPLPLEQATKRILLENRFRSRTIKKKKKKKKITYLLYAADVCYPVQ